VVTVRRIVRAKSGAQVVAFVGGVQVAAGTSTLVHLFGVAGDSAQMAKELPWVPISAGLLWVAGFLSMKLSGAIGDLRRGTVERAVGTILSDKTEQLIAEALNEPARFLGISSRREVWLIVLAVVDGLLTLAAVLSALGMVLL
jgi:hypothetical protein